MASEPSEASGARRLHPSTLVFAIGRALRNLVIPAVLAVFGGRGSVWEAIFVVAFVLSVAHALFRYLTLTWELRSDELVVKEGMFFRSERHVPYTRIQNVDLVQSLFHRLFHVAEVRIETASGTEPEATLRVLTLADVALIRTRIRAAPVGAVDGEGTTDDAAAEEAGTLLVAVPPSHLVFLGLVVNRGLAVMGVGFGLLYELGSVDMVFRDLGLEDHVTSLVQSGFAAAVLTILLLTVSVVVVLVGLSILWSLIRFHGFTLRAVGDDLRLSCGLLTRVSASIPRPRIQSLTIDESWLHRWFGFASIQVRTAGGGSGEEAANVLRRRFVPVMREAEVPRVVREVLPAVRGEELDWQPISRTAARRLRRRALVVIGLLGTPALYFTVYASIPIVVAGVVAWLHAGAAARRARFASTPWGLVWQRGVVTRRTTLLPNDKMQTVHLTNSPFDRRNKHATIYVDAAGGGLGSSEVQIRFLDADVAEGLRRELHRRAVATEFLVGAPRNVHAPA